MSVTVNKHLYGKAFNKCNTVTDNESNELVTFNNCNEIHCEKCGNDIGDNDPVYVRRFYIHDGQTVYAYEWLGWYLPAGEARIYTHSNHQFLSVCSNCVDTYFKNRNINSGQCLVCSRTVTKKWSLATLRESYRWFCNRLHKEAYYSRLQREKREAKREDISCLVCNIVFIPKRTGAVTCSNKCRQKLYRFKQQTNGLKEKEPQLAKESLAEMSKAWAV